MTNKAESKRRRKQQCEVGSEFLSDRKAYTRTQRKWLDGALKLGTMSITQVIDAMDGSKR